MNDRAARLLTFAIAAVALCAAWLQFMCAPRFEL